MLLTSAADSTAMHNKFANFADYNNLAPPNPSIVSRNLEVNLGEVSSTTDILPSPPSKPDPSFMRCTSHHDTSPTSIPSIPLIKADPDQPSLHNIYTSSSLHSPAAFFNPQHYFQPGSCATNIPYQTPTAPGYTSRYEHSYPVTQPFSGAALSSLLAALCCLVVGWVLRCCSLVICFSIRLDR